MSAPYFSGDLFRTMQARTAIAEASSVGGRLTPERAEAPPPPDTPAAVSPLSAALIIGRPERDLIAGLCRRAEAAPLSLAETRRQMRRAIAAEPIESPAALTIALPTGWRAALTIEESTGGGRDRHLRLWSAVRGRVIAIEDALVLLPFFGFRARNRYEAEAYWWDVNPRALNFLEVAIPGPPGDQREEVCDTWQPIGAVVERVVDELEREREPGEDDDDEYFRDDDGPDDDA